MKTWHIKIEADWDTLDLLDQSAVEYKVCQALPPQLKSIEVTVTQKAIPMGGGDN